MREVEEANPKLFDGLTAWFSCSVQNKRKQLWFDNDGEEASVDEAMFVFSENADEKDTKSLYSSPIYIKDSLAIFHASYIDECIHCGDMKKVIVGKYFLPPSDVYDKIKSNVRYSYDYTGNGTADSCQHGRNGQLTEELQKDCNGESSSHDPHAEYVKIETLRQVVGPVCDFIVGQNNCHVQKLNSLQS